MAFQSFEFEQGGRNFRFLKMHALDQAKLLKRVMPLVPGVMPVLVKVREDYAKAQEEADKTGKTVEAIMAERLDLRALAELLQTFADSISDLPDKDLEWLIETCCMRLQIQDTDAGTWVTFWAKGTREPMFADMDDIQTVLPLTIRVVMENLGPFLTSLVTKGLKKLPTA